MPKRKPGRKRKQVNRYPSGQPVHATPTESAEEARAVGIAQRMQHHGRTKQQAQSDLGGTAIGRMLQDGIITRDEHEALERYGKLRESYLKTICGPSRLIASPFEREPKGHNDNSNASRDAAIAEEWSKVSEALTVAHADAQNLISDAVLFDDEPAEEKMGAFMRGVFALTRLWGLGDR